MLSVALAVQLDFARLLTLTSFVNCQAMLLHDSAVCTATSSSGRDAASAHQAISVRQVRAACRGLSPCDTALLQVLGFSSEAVVWSAAALLSRHPATHVKVHAATSVLVSMLTGTVMAGDAVPSQPQALIAQQPLWQLTHKLVRLVPAMLLRWAARAIDPTRQGPGPSDASRHLHAVLQNTRLRELFGLLVNASMTLILQWAQHTASCSSAGARSSSTAGSSTAGSSTAGSSTADGVAGAGSSIWLQSYLPAECLQQVFPDVHTICSACVVEPSAGSAAPSLVTFQTQLLSRAAEVPTTISGSSELPELSAAAAPQPLPAPLAAFQGVALQTIASFDGFARSTAQQTAADTQAATVDARKAASSITSVCFSSRDGSRPGPLLALVQAAGPGSREQQALYSCLCSVAKLGAVGAAPGHGVGQWGHLLFRVARIAMLLLELQAGGAGQGSTGTGSTAAVTATVYIPSLVLVGRCFQFWAHQLQEVAPSLQQLHSTGADPLQARPLRSELAPEQCPTTCTVFSPGPGPASSTRFERLVLQLLDWLADSSGMQQLSAEGYSVQQLPAMLQGLLAAHAAGQRSLDGEGCMETSCAALQAELEAAGAALTALATPAFCNNPACQNVSGPTELSLVSGRSCLCGGCCVACYCSHACQRAHWAHHKPVCKALAAAAETADATGPAHAAGGADAAAAGGAVA